MRLGGGLARSPVPDRARQWADDLLMLARLTRDLPGFLRRPITLDEARARLRRSLDAREDRFSIVVERLIYEHPGSPYLALLRNAGCELGDVQALVRQEGVEGTLRTLSNRGVFVTFDEFKGRKEAVRGSTTFAFSDRDFDNRLVVRHFAVPTGGTRGLPTMAGRSLTYIAEKALSRAIAADAHGFHGAGYVFWQTGPIAQIITYAKLGHPILAWFHPLQPLPLNVRLGARYLDLVGRLAGHSFPSPTHLDLQQAHRLAVDLAGWTSEGRKVVVNLPTSSAVRTAVAAQAAGIELERVTFNAQSEPMTPARRAHIEAAGASVMPTYGINEATSIAYGCATPDGADDLHLFEELFAAVTRRRAVSPGGPEVDALLVTSLSVQAEKVLFNTETGDFARLEERDCGCALGAIGMRTHLSSILSFEKLTGEGMTIVGTRLVEFLEMTLPSRFGGSSVDYQLVEEEGSDSATRLVLRVHPSVGTIDEPAMLAVLLDELGRASHLDTHTVEIWKRAGTVRFCREPPLATPAGKVLPFHPLGARSASAARVEHPR